MSDPTPEQIEEHRGFLAKITAGYRDTVLGMMEPRARLAADYEIQGLIYAAMEQGRYDNVYPPQEPA